MGTLWTGIQAGDVGFDQGGGLVGFLIRHFSHSPYAHCWVYHGKGENNQWLTAEAYPGGLKWKKRKNDSVHKVTRAWRDEEERQAILDKSEELIGSGYNYRELFRIIHYRLRKIILYLIPLATLFLLAWGMSEALLPQVMFWFFAVLTLYAALPLKTRLNKKKVICSNHVAQSVLAARPDAVLTYEPQSIWPGRLERDLNVLTWNDWTINKEL